MEGVFSACLIFLNLSRWQGRHGWSILGANIHMVGQNQWKGGGSWRSAPANFSNVTKAIHIFFYRVLFVLNMSYALSKSKLILSILPIDMSTILAKVTNLESFYYDLSCFSFGFQNFNRKSCALF